MPRVMVFPLAALLLCFSAEVLSGSTEPPPPILDPVEAVLGPDLRGIDYRPNSPRYVTQPEGSGSLGGAVAVCGDLRKRIPLNTREWCTVGKTDEQLYRDAAKHILLRIASDQLYGTQSGLGELHVFLNHPDSRRNAAGYGNAHDVIVGLLAAGLRRAADGGAISWDGLTASMFQACFIVERSYTGWTTGGLGGRRDSMDSCFRSVAVLRMEMSGVPFDADRERNFLEGISLGVGAGVSVSADLGRILTEILNAAGYNEGLKASSSIQRFAEIYETEMKSCADALEAMKAAGCRS